MIALLRAGSDNTSRSALPHAPVVTEVEKPKVAAWKSLRGGVATTLHRLAWAIEPKVPR